MKIDPGVKTNIKDLQLQHNLSMMCYNNIEKCRKILKEITEKNDPALTEKEKNIARYIGIFNSLQNTLQDSDMPPTTQMIKAVNEAGTGFDALYKKE